MLARLALEGGRQRWRRRRRLRAAAHRHVQYLVFCLARVAGRAGLKTAACGVPATHFFALMRAAYACAMLPSFTRSVPCRRIPLLQRLARRAAAIGAGIHCVIMFGSAAGRDAVLACLLPPCLVAF